MDRQLLPSNGAWSLPGLHLYRGGLGWGGLPQHTIDDMRLDVGKVQLSAVYSHPVGPQSLPAMATSSVLYLPLLVSCTLVISQDLLPSIEPEPKTAVTAGQEGPFGANSPNLNYCCGPSGYCKPCKDQTRPVGGPINYPAWISQIYGK